MFRSRYLLLPFVFRKSIAGLRFRSFEATYFRPQYQQHVTLPSDIAFVKQPYMLVGEQPVHSREAYEQGFDINVFACQVFLLSEIASVSSYRDRYQPVCIFWLGDCCTTLLVDIYGAFKKLQICSSRNLVKLETAVERI